MKYLWLNFQHQTMICFKKVKPCTRYRFRVVSPGFTLCPIVVSVDDHNLTMIASDGAPFNPQQVRSFIVHPGERSADAVYIKNSCRNIFKQKLLERENKIWRSNMSNLMVPDMTLSSQLISHHPPISWGLQDSLIALPPRLTVWLGSITGTLFYEFILFNAIFPN